MLRVRSFAPGRTELAGNHTDHQGGRVIAAAVEQGVEMLVSVTGTPHASIESEGFAPVGIDVTRTAPVEAERGTTAALVRGVVAGLVERGVQVGGFEARVRSSLPAGGGLSSSAAFELALTRALAKLFDDAEFAPLELARIGQAAERDYFGKPCGLMDQLAVASGGICLFDFGAGRPSTSGIPAPSAPSASSATSVPSASASVPFEVAACSRDAQPAPLVQRLDFDFEQAGWAVCLIDVHCDHSRFTQAYAQVARDMDAVARHLGLQMLSQIDRSDFLEHFEGVRSALGDVPALRAAHYYREMDLVDARARALSRGDMDAFLQATRQSGASSGLYLQNVSTFDRSYQPAMVALALCDLYAPDASACRIHGGGFGGTVQAFVPLADYEAFALALDSHLGAGSCMRLKTNSKGAWAQWE